MDKEYYKLMGALLKQLSREGEHYARQSPDTDTIHFF